MNEKTSTLKRWVGRPEFSSLLIMLVMFAITAYLQNNFFEQKSLVRTYNAFIPLILMAMGQAVVIISGGLDLSAGSALSLMTVVLTYIMKKDDPASGYTALLATAGVAVLIGVVNGIGIGYLRLPPVIVTYATSYLWLGIGLFLRPTPGGQVTTWFPIFYDFKLVEGMPEFMIELGKTIPPSLWLLIIGCVGWFFLSKTRIVRYMYAVGSNNDNAYASGIDTGKTQMVACIINALFIFLAALFFTGQNQSGDARMGDPMTLKVIASAVVGGIALTGGKGNVYFAIVGALTLSFVNKIIFFANIPNAYQTLVSGLIIIVAIAGSLVYTFFSRRAMLKEGMK